MVMYSTSVFCAEKQSIFQGTNVVNPTTDLVYLGAFQLPNIIYHKTTWSYGGQGMCFYPKGNPNRNPTTELPGSLFIIGRHSNNTYRVAEVSIPKSVISNNKNLKRLPVAKMLQLFADLTGGKQSGALAGGHRMTDIQYISKELSGSQDDYIYWLLFEFYLPPCQSLILGRTKGTDFSICEYSAICPAEGLWRVKNVCAAAVQRYMFTIPKSFADKYLNGKYLAVGRFRVLNGGSWGPALFAIAPWKYENVQGNIPNGTVIDGVKLIFYPGHDKPYHLNDKRMLEDFSNGDEWSDGVWITIGKKSAIIIAGRKALRTMKNGLEYYGLPGPYGSFAKGFQAEPYYHVLLFYDPKDVVKVIKRKIKPYEIQPYTFFQFEKYLFKPGNGGFGGVAYDQEHQLLYIIERDVGRFGAKYDRSPIVHVFKIIDSHEPLDTQPPTTPKNLRVENITEKTITIKWDPVSDDKGNVIYVVYRIDAKPNYRAHWLYHITWTSKGMNDPICKVSKPVPIAITIKPEFKDSKAYAFVFPQKYLVRAYDSVMNASDFSSVLIIQKLRSSY